MKFTPSKYLPWSAFAAVQGVIPTNIAPDLPSNVAALAWEYAHTSLAARSTIDVDGQKVTICEQDVIALKALLIGLNRYVLVRSKSKASLTAYDLAIDPDDDAASLSGEGLKMMFGGILITSDRAADILDHDPRFAALRDSKDFIKSHLSKFDKKGKDGRIVGTPLFEAWLELTPYIGLQVAGLMHDPALPVPIAETKAGLMLNQVRVSEPAMLCGLHDRIEASTKTFEDYVATLIPDESDRAYFLAWLGFKFKNPCAVLPMILFCQKKHGSGRGSLFGVVSAIIGAEYVEQGLKPATFDPSTSVARNNGWQARALLATVDEVAASRSREHTSASAADRSAMQNHLRYLVNPGEGNRSTVEDKYVRSASRKIICSILAATNNMHALALPPEDRRVVVIDNGITSDGQQKALRALVEDPEALAAIAQYCMARAFSSAEEAYQRREPNAATLRMMGSGADGEDLESIVERVMNPQDGDPEMLPGRFFEYGHLLYAVAEVRRREYGEDEPLNPAERRIVKEIAKELSPIGAKRTMTVTPWRKASAPNKRADEPERRPVLMCHGPDSDHWVEVYEQNKRGGRPQGGASRSVSPINKALQENQNRMNHHATGAPFIRKMCADEEDAILT